MRSSDKWVISVGARASPLSQAQCAEVLRELRLFHPEVHFIPVWVKTTGDFDLCTSLRSLNKTDFFTKEIDEMQLRGDFRLSIHSAKDLPEPLCLGLKLIALTKGVDSADVLVMREKETLSSLPFGALVGTSCFRREKAVLALRPDLRCVDIRGTIEKRLQKLDEGQVDAVVMAEAALIRLHLLQRNRIRLQGEVAPLQGQLAVIAKEKDIEMEKLFACIDIRRDYTETTVHARNKKLG